MDIALYIGQFLLKNRFCYLHGLGNLEFVKKAAHHDGSALQPPQYEVVLTPTGSIDDSLANYIATNEQISISKAANALREFSTEARSRLNQGEEVPIPGIGKFSQQEGQIHFVTDPAVLYKPKGIPVVKSALKEPTEIDYYDIHEQQKSPKRSWGKILLVLVLIAGLGLALYLGMNNVMPSAPTEKAASTGSLPAEIETKATDPASNAGSDSTTTELTSPQETLPEPAVASSPGSRLLFVINTYPSLAAAERRHKQLTSYGNQVEIHTLDSNRYSILMPIPEATILDTSRIQDSLSRLFNPSGVSVFHP